MLTFREKNCRELRGGRDTRSRASTAPAHARAHRAHAPRSQAVALASQSSRIMPLRDVSNADASAKNAQPKGGLLIPGLTVPAPVAQTKVAPAKVAAKPAAKTAKAPARAAGKKRAAGARKEVAMTTTLSPTAAKAKAAAENHRDATPEKAAAPAGIMAVKTPGVEPKTPGAALTGAKTPNVSFAVVQDARANDEGAPEGEEGRKMRHSRRGTLAPERFGEFTEWDKVQKGTLGTPGHGLLTKGARLGGSSDSSAGTSRGSGRGSDVSSSSSAAESFKEVATPKTARFNSAAGNATVAEVHERVAALMRMADAVLPGEEAAAEGPEDQKTLREQLSDSWNGQGYYAKLMTQMATPKKTEPSTEKEDNKPNKAKRAEKAERAEKAPALKSSWSGGENPSLAACAAAGAAAVAAAAAMKEKEAKAKRAHGVAAHPSTKAKKASLSPAADDVAALKAELETAKMDASLAESEAESMKNTLESYTAQLRAKDAENKKLKAELAEARGIAEAAVKKMAAAMRSAADAAEARAVAELHGKEQ